MRLSKTAAAAFALVAPIGIGMAITTSAAVGIDSAVGTESDSGDHFEDEFSTAEGYMIQRDQSFGGAAAIVVNDPNGNLVDPADYNNLPQDTADVLDEVSDDNWQPPDPFGPEGSFGPNGPWQYEDGEPPCYNRDVFEPDTGWGTSGDEGSFAGATDQDGEWIQEPVYFESEIDHELLGDAVMHGAAFELEGAQALEPCE